MINVEYQTTESDTRQAVFAELTSTWGAEVSVSLNHSGSVFIGMQETPVICRFATLHTGHVVVEVESPIRLDFVPSADFYELVARMQLQTNLGSLHLIVDGASGEAMLVAIAKLFADGLTATHLKRAIMLVHSTARSQIQLLAGLNDLGGRGAYG